MACLGFARRRDGAPSGAAASSGRAQPVCPSGSTRLKSPLNPADNEPWLGNCKETAAETTWFLYAGEGLIAEPQGDVTLKRACGWKPQGLWGTDPLWFADRAPSGDWSAHVDHNDHPWTRERSTDA